ncbi:hypothetical protein CISG_04850 [Coccidioides immitis RMSCC 3703]|uniref:Uncharacterized protein n=2 Tax=Coccidioides immitis TaxID=5501 RepID=A0A0J8QUE2_COCIT|nr:hypothetical protein CIRG_08863 [Coccidioides immitis RMSCC 2394]KMU75675.1 hypothetical protein CISG_04850 [Coccidioides immitis RMSCC 3703]
MHLSTQMRINPDNEKGEPRHPCSAFADHWTQRDGRQWSFRRKSVSLCAKAPGTGVIEAVKMDRRTEWECSIILVTEKNYKGLHRTKKLKHWTYSSQGKSFLWPREVGRRQGKKKVRIVIVPHIKRLWRLHGGGKLSLAVRNHRSPIGPMTQVSSSTVAGSVLLQEIRAGGGPGSEKSKGAIL